MRGPGRGRVEGARGKGCFAGGGHELDGGRATRGASRVRARARKWERERGTRVLARGAGDGGVDVDERWGGG